MFLNSMKKMIKSGKIKMTNLIEVNYNQTGPKQKQTIWVWERCNKWFMKKDSQYL